MGVFMRLWIGIAATAVAIIAADTQPAGARSAGFAAGFAGHGGGRVIAHPAAMTRVAMGQRPPRPFHPHPFLQRGTAFASAAGYGYGFDGPPPDPYNSSLEPPTDVPAAIGPGQAMDAPAGLPGPAWLYGYGLPPRPACFKPRLIMIGKAAPKSHLPKVVYGGPLACGYKG